MKCYPFIHSFDFEDCEPAPDLQLVCAHDCPAQPLEWLWPEIIPFGKVTLLIGEPGTGKSLVAIDIAARASRAGDWPHFPAHAPCAVTEPESTQGNKDLQGEITPDGQISSSPCLPVPVSLPSDSLVRAPCSTLILSAYDDLADTIRPRLDAAGADPRRVFLIPSISDLRADFNQLRVAVNCPRDCRLVIIDPINAYIGPGGSVAHKVLAPLASLAARKRIAVVAVAHLRASDSDAIYRAASSTGYAAWARAVWSVVRDAEFPNRYLLLPVKNNNRPGACGLAYTLRPTGPSAEPALVWDPTPIQLERLPARRRWRGAIDLHPVRLWLREALAAGPRAAGELLQAGARLGFHERTARRALQALGGHTQHGGVMDGWWWSLSPEMADRRGLARVAESVEQSAPLDRRVQPHTEETVPLCPLPENFTDPPAENPPLSDSAAHPPPSSTGPSIQNSKSPSDFQSFTSKNSMPG